MRSSEFNISLVVQFYRFGACFQSNRIDGERENASRTRFNRTTTSDFLFICSKIQTPVRVQKRNPLCADKHPDGNEILFEQTDRMTFFTFVI